MWGEWIVDMFHKSFLLAKECQIIYRQELDDKELISDM